MSFYSKIITVPSEFNIEKYMNTFFIGGFAVHLIVVLFDYFLMIKPFAFESRDIFSRSIISTLMHPAVIICGLFSVVIWFIWEKRKKALDLAHKTEIQKEKVDAVFKSMERITGLFAEHVAVQNSVIMSWIEYKKRKGQQVSKRVENPNIKIAQALQSFSKFSFVTPYTANPPGSIDEIEDMLECKLNEINNLRSEQ